jgi:hypothetical protein
LEHLAGPAVPKVSAPPVKRRQLTAEQIDEELKGVSFIGGAGGLPGIEHLEGPATARKRMPPRPSTSVAQEPKVEAPAEVSAKETEPRKGGFAFGRGGGVGVVPTREPVKPERIGKFIDPTQAYTLGVGGIGKQDVVGGQDYLDLQRRREKIMGSIAYKFPKDAKEAGRMESQLDAISKEQRAIRTGIETGIRGGVEAKTKQVEASSTAAAVRDALDEKQRTRIAEQEQFDIQEERLATTAAAGVGTERIKARAAFAGPRPKLDDYFGDQKAYQAALAAWQEQYRAAPVSGGVGAPVAAPQAESYTQYL